MIKLIGNLKWKIKYNRLCNQYETLANTKINELESQNKILLKNMEYRDEIDRLNEQLREYKRLYGRLKGGDKNDKDKSKR